MKMKLSQIIGAHDPLRRLAGEKFPANIAYRIQRNLRTIEPEVVAYNKSRNELIKTKYGEKSDEGYRVKPDKIEAFTNEINEMLAEEVDVNIVTIEFEWLREISPLDMMALDWMFDSPKNEKIPSKSKPAKSRKRG